MDALVSVPLVIRSPLFLARFGLGPGYDSRYSESFLSHVGLLVYYAQIEHSIPGPFRGIRSDHTRAERAGM